MYQTIGNQVLKRINQARDAGIRWKAYEDCFVHYDQGVAVVENYVRSPRPNRGGDNKINHPFNEYQYFLYSRCLYGLNMYSRDEIEYMNPDKKNRIINRHKQTAHVLNLYRQELLVRRTNRILQILMEKLFASKLTEILNQKFLNPDPVECIDPEFICTFTFKQLGVTKQMIASRLVEKQVLPWRFFELKLTDDPRAKKLLAPQDKLD